MVHRADDVAVGPLAIAHEEHRVAVVLCALVLHGPPLLIARAQKLLACREVRPPTTLVAQRPDDDGSVILAALVHVPRPIQKLGSPTAVACEQRDRTIRGEAMRLNVRLVDNIQTMLIAEFVPTSMMRIVAVAHGVEVPLLEQADVFQHVLVANGLATRRMHLVHVRAADDDGLPVHAQLPVNDAHAAEADMHTLRLQHLAVAGQQLHDQRIQHGLLGVPPLDVRDLNIRGFDAVLAFSNMDLLVRRVGSRRQVVEPPS
mmetsp:Transcript_38228/g.109880  ORF Transcript_38228/g.109880 Transcript_38228/m.109880 type:complete len:259 (+) Transcript_38228:1327-2103(+)